MELLLPEVKAPAPPMPSYVKLAMAFGVGAGATLFDKSRYRSHGAITGTVWAAGLHGYSLDFDPTIPSYVEIPAAHTQLDFTAEDFSIICRVYIDDLTANRYIFDRGRHLFDGYFFRVHADGHLSLFTSQFGVAQQSGTLVGGLVINTWYTLGCSRNGASVRVFINGVDSTTTVGAHLNPLNCARAAQIGIEFDLVSSPFDGKIEFLGVFGGVALGASEHLAWHRALA